MKTHVACSHLRILNGRSSISQNLSPPSTFLHVAKYRLVITVLKVINTCALLRPQVIEFNMNSLKGYTILNTLPLNLWVDDVDV